MIEQEEDAGPQGYRPAFKSCNTCAKVNKVTTPVRVAIDITFIRTSPLHCTQYEVPVEATSVCDSYEEPV